MHLVPRLWACIRPVPRWRGIPARNVFQLKTPSLALITDCRVKRRSQSLLSQVGTVGGTIHFLVRTGVLSNRCSILPANCSSAGRAPGTRRLRLTPCPSPTRASRLAAPVIARRPPVPLAAPGAVGVPVAAPVPVPPGAAVGVPVIASRRARRVGVPVDGALEPMRLAVGVPVY